MPLTTYRAFRIPSRQPVAGVTGTVKLFRGAESGHQWMVEASAERQKCHMAG